MDMTEVQAAWVAGIIEGEGCITWQGASARIRVKMSDRDTIARLAEWTGMGRVFEEPTQDDRKDLWSWTINRQEDFLSLCRQIEPFLMERRTARMNEVRDRLLLHRADIASRTNWRSEQGRRSWITRRANMEASK